MIKITFWDDSFCGFCSFYPEIMYPAENKKNCYLNCDFHNKIEDLGGAVSVLD